MAGFNPRAVYGTEGVAYPNQPTKKFRCPTSLWCTISLVSWAIRQQVANSRNLLQYTRLLFDASHFLSTVDVLKVGYRYGSHADTPIIIIAWTRQRPAFWLAESVGQHRRRGSLRKLTNLLQSAQLVTRQNNVIQKLRINLGPIVVRVHLLQESVVYSPGAFAH